MPNENNLVEVRDVAMLAVLKMQGIEPVKIYKEDKGQRDRVTFVFRQSPLLGTLQKELSDGYMVDAMRFYNVVCGIRRQIYDTLYGIDGPKRGRR